MKYIVISLLTAILSISSMAFANPMKPADVKKDGVTQEDKAENHEDSEEGKEEVKK